MLFISCIRTIVENIYNRSWWLDGLHSHALLNNILWNLDVEEGKIDLQCLKSIISLPLRLFWVVSTTRRPKIWL